MGLSPRTLRPANNFTPRSIRGLALWLDASDSSSYTIATGVSEWRDKSGNNRTFAQSTGNNQPAVTTLSSGKTVFTFDGTNDSFTSQTSLSLSSTHSVFAVVLPRIRKIGVFLGGASGAELFYGDGSSFSGSKFGAFGIARVVYGGGDITTGVRQIVSVVCSGSANPTNLSMWTNGVGGPVSVVTAGSDLTAAMTTPLMIGTSSGNQFWDGQIAEILIYDNAVSNIGRGSIERWLGGKWGITVA